MAISVLFSVIIYNISSAEIDRGLGRQVKVFNDLHDIEALPPFSEHLESIRAEQLNISRTTIKHNLVYFNLLILIGSTLGSYFFARKTLQPIGEMVEAQNRFAADASHELKTPLTAMRSEIEVSLREKDLDLSRAKKLLSSNLEEIAKLEDLSNALLKLSRYRQQARGEFSRIPVEDVIVGAFEKVEPMAKKKNITFQNSFQKISISGDKQSLVELFVILLDNAIKYSPEKSRVEIKVAGSDKHALISVKNSGPGILKDDLEHVFDRFYRADSSRTKEDIPGFGLGLSIAKSIVELHDGSISVASSQEKGTTFSIKIPD
jgi:signal transduction histidine kinase